MGKFWRKDTFISDEIRVDFLCITTKKVVQLFNNLLSFGYVWGNDGEVWFP